MFSLDKNAQVVAHVKTHWGIYYVPQVEKKNGLLSLTFFFC